MIFETRHHARPMKINIRCPPYFLIREREMAYGICASPRIMVKEMINIRKFLGAYNNATNKREREREMRCVYGLHILDTMICQRKWRGSVSMG